MRFSNSCFFHESKVPIGPRVILKIENIFIFAEIFTKKGFFRSNFRDTIPGGCTTSRYRNPDILQPLGNDTQILLEKNLHE